MVDGGLAIFNTTASHTSDFIWYTELGDGVRTEHSKPLHAQINTSPVYYT